ncbi:GNAT family protein [Nocardia sp. NPDC005366]|uniref:GNAT family N-acetyltransferase n=1 Tax=Nocardia sp. NPDC005366 TaxID=3156878 RepID=UPI0033AFAF64
MAFRYPDDVPVLADGMVTLRAHRQQDLDAIVEQGRDVEMIRYTTVPRPYGRDDARDFLQRTAREWEQATPTSRRGWAITKPLPEGGTRFCGTVDYRPTGVGTAMIGFGLHPAARGEGLMGRAVSLVLDHAFAHDIEVMHWQAVVGNWASRKTVWRLGFRLEGTVRKLLVQPGSAQDGWIASLHRDDPRRPCEPWPTECPNTAR